MTVVSTYGSYGVDEVEDSEVSPVPPVTGAFGLGTEPPVETGGGVRRVSTTTLPTRGRTDSHPGVKEERTTSRPGCLLPSGYAGPPASRVRGPSPYLFLEYDRDVPTSLERESVPVTHGLRGSGPPDPYLYVSTPR